MSYLREQRGLKEEIRFDPNMAQNGIVIPMDSEVGSNSARYTNNFRLEPPEVRALSGHDTVSEMPQLKDMASRRIITLAGKVDPVVLPGTQYTCFAILDFVQKVQFVGFSKDLRNTLRKIVARQPEKAFFYMSIDMADSSPEHLSAVHRAWLSEMDGVPVGNQPDNEASWIGPISCGDAAAAKARAAAVMEQLATKRGLKESFEFDPALMAQGQLDVLPTKEQARVLVTNSGDCLDDMDLWWLATRNKAERNAVSPNPTDIATRAKAATSWIADWRKASGGEATFPGNPAPGFLASITDANLAYSEGCAIPGSNDAVPAPPPPKPKAAEPARPKEAQPLEFGATVSWV